MQHPDIHQITMRSSGFSSPATWCRRSERAPCGAGPWRHGGLDPSLAHEHGDFPERDIAAGKRVCLSPFLQFRDIYLNHGIPPYLMCTFEGMYYQGVLARRLLPYLFDSLLPEWSWYHVSLLFIWNNHM